MFIRRWQTHRQELWWGWVEWAANPHHIVPQCEYSIYFRVGGWSGLQTHIILSLSVNITFISGRRVEWATTAHHIVPLHE